ncbi:MAG: right-handed parallel beta-helix repeat-containing protein [Bacillota bacterium]
MYAKAARRGRKRWAAVLVFLIVLFIALDAYIDWRGTLSGFWGIHESVNAYPGLYTYPGDEDWYTIDNDRFGIDSTGGHAGRTTDGINAALQWASLAGRNKVRLPKGTYLIRCAWSNPYIMPDDGIKVPSGMTLDLGDATLMIEPNGSPCYCIISVAEKTGVTILGGTLAGDRDSHDYSTDAGLSTHEWGFGIAVAASTDVLIQDVTIRDTTGDGIILEGSYKPLKENGKLSANVRIYHCDISNCRRQGVSVVGATDSIVAGNEIYGINGTPPEYGIDVEPGLDYRADNVKIYDNLIYGCRAGAVSCHSGSNYEVYANRCKSNSIIAVECSNVKIYNNSIESSLIRVYRNASNVQVYDNRLDLLSRLIIEN